MLEEASRLNQTVEGLLLLSKAEEGEMALNVVTFPLCELLNEILSLLDVIIEERNVNGSIDTAAPPPTVGCPTEGTAVTTAIAAQAALDAQTAYTALVAFPNGLDVSTCPGCGGGLAGELGNRTHCASRNPKGQRHMRATAISMRSNS